MNIIETLIPTIIILLSLYCSTIELAAISDKQVQKVSLGKKAQIEKNPEFYKKRVFPLSTDNIRLIGGKHSLIRTGQLPFWFDFETFKYQYKKNYPTREEELARNHAYIRTCIRVLKARTLFRILAGIEDTFITKDADKLPDERISNGNNSFVYLTDSKTNDSIASSKDEINFSLSLEPDLEEDENVIARAKRLLMAELDRVESKNQLVNYLKAFESEISPFI